MPELLFELFSEEIPARMQARAADDLRRNTDRAGVTVETVRQNSEAFLIEANHTPDFILADPPRAGLGAGAVTRLLEIAPRKIAIVACDPATLARDQPNVVRTGVTAIWPSDDIFTDFRFAGFHSFNGNGEMTGTIWLQEQGLLAAPICITHTHAVRLPSDVGCVDPSMSEFPLSERSDATLLETGELCVH